MNRPGEMHGELNEIRGELKEMHGELEEMHGELNEIRGELKEMHGELNEIRGDLKEMHGELEEMHGELNEIRGELKEMHGELDKLGCPWLASAASIPLMIERGFWRLSRFEDVLEDVFFKALKIRRFSRRTVSVLEGFPDLKILLKNSECSSRCMITRQKGGPLEPLNLEIEATARRNRGRNRREQLRRRIEIEEMAEDNLIDPEIDRGVNGQENGQEMQNAQGGHLPPQHAQGGGGPQQGGQNQGPHWNAQGYYPLESWHNNPHLKRGDELEIKFITVASEDMTNSIRYPSFHFMKLQRPDHRSANYIKDQETKPELVINLTEDEVTTRRAWGVWVCLTEMDKVKYPFKIYQNSVNESFLLNTMTGNTTRFANEVLEQKRAMIWENKLIGTESTRRKACNMMHVERWHERICQFCATQEKPLFGRNFPVKRDRSRKNEKARPSYPQGSTQANTTY
ncbi:hypothetical protein ACS0TY_014139 [Phlomoides rotata]